MNRKNFYYASANTGAGFVGFLDKINLQHTTGFVYIIKGGPGTGKSTLMKNIAEKFWQEGCGVEYFYCSSDPASLDGVRIKEKNIAIVDGTAPHIVEPSVVGITHKIVDVGQFVDGKILSNSATILELTKQKKQRFESAYNYLASAKTLQDENVQICQNSCSSKLIQKKAKALFLKIKKVAEDAEDRTFFLDAFGGANDNLEKQNSFKKIVFEASKYESFLVLEVLEKMLKKNQFFFTKICDNLDFKKIKNIIINNEIIVKNIDKKIKINKKIEKNNKIIKKIINFAKNELFEAKKIHKKLEAFYVPCVDFLGIEKLSQKLIEEIKLR